MKCLKCNSDFDEIDFYGPYCSRACRTHVSRGAIKASATAWRNKTRDLPITRYKRYRASAIKRGYMFALDMDQFMLHWQKPCYYCGIEIKTIGLDRMDNNKGYLIDNIVPCCTRCNLSKYKANTAEFIALCKLIASRF